VKAGKRTIIGAILAAVMCLSAAAPAWAAGSAYNEGGQKLAALTFDDGPGKYSDKIMDTLEARGAKATFFMNGYLIKKYPEAVKRMARDGFQMGNHTYDHPYLTRCPADKVKAELSSTAKLITQLTGVAGTGDTGFYLRPPYGSWNKSVIAEAGVPVIWCTVDSGDWKYDSADHLVSYVGSAVKDGDIVIMHESHSTTAAGLARLVDKLQARGFQLVTVQELFARRGVAVKAGSIYYSARNKGINRCASEEYYDETKLSSHWAHEAIGFVLDGGYMSKNQYGEFLPNFPVTRAEFVTVLGRLAGVHASGGASGFKDVPESSYAAPYAAWAAEKGIMSGEADGKFSPKANITRQQIAAILERYQSYLGADTGGDTALVYSDAAAISGWALKGAAYCTASGLMQGADGRFDPNGTVTRAMCAELIMRLSQMGAAPETASAAA
jgi:peptidoglycan/xylan/chitin deacetylase (PgdA/CDA1 family)